MSDPRNRNLIVATVETARKFTLAAISLTEDDPQAHREIAALVATFDDVLDELRKPMYMGRTN